MGFGYRERAGRGSDKNNTPEMKGGYKENRYCLSFPFS